MATLGPEPLQSAVRAPETSPHDNRFGLTSPWEHYYQPSDTALQGRFECDLDEMVVFGDIPREISGTWYRMLIDPHFCPQVGTPFVDGDGHVCAFRIQDGKISMKIKYIHTERWLLERKAGRRLFGRYRNPFDNHPCVRLANDSTGNTNIIYWSGNLLALAERGLPYALDPDTLETKGPDPYGGQTLAKTFAAHPKVDPRKNELVTWSYSAKGLSSPDICTYSIDPNGVIANEHWFKQDKPGWPHDGWITDNWIILSNMPFGVNSDDVMKAGGDYWRSSTLEAWRVPQVHRASWFDHSHGQRMGGGWDFETREPLLSFNVFYFFNPKDYEEPKRKPSGDWLRWTLDLSKPDGSPLPPPETLLHGIFDFPIFDERMTGCKTKIVYLGGMMAPDGAFQPKFDAVIMLNTETGEKSIFHAAKDGSVAEPAYIPRGPDCEEGDGWLIFYSQRESLPIGELFILDTNDFSTPVAIAQLPFRVRNQVHGNWVPNPHPETPLPLMTGSIRTVIPSTKYSQLNRLAESIQ